MADTSIEWTQKSWNPVAGCTIISPGCTNCYAMRQAGRIELMGKTDSYNGTTRKTGGRFKWTGKINLIPKKLNEPKKWRQGRFVFVNSMSDLFHEDVPDSYIRQVFKSMRETPRHIFQVLTKRPERLVEMDWMLDWTDNIWMGVSVENGEYKHRIDLLRQCNAHTRFISAEPLLGPLHGLNLTGIHWVIVGGESGPGARPMDAMWVRQIQQQCQHANVAFFFKQWGGANKSANGRVLGDRTYSEMPDGRRLPESYEMAAQQNNGSIELDLFGNAMEDA